MKDQLILKAVIIPASVNDSQAFDELIDEGDRIVYADSAYAGVLIEAVLNAKNVDARINEKGTRGHPLSEKQKASNREKSRTRSRVEPVYAPMSGSKKALYQRCIGMKHKASCLILTNPVYNTLRYEQIKAPSSTSQRELCPEQTFSDEKRPRTYPKITNRNIDGSRVTSK